MSEEKDVKDELKKLKEELQGLKDQLREIAPSSERKRRGISIDIEDRMSDYLGDIMEGVAEGIRGELEKSIFISPHGQHIKIYRGGREEPEEEPGFGKDDGKDTNVAN